MPVAPVTNIRYGGWLVSRCLTTHCFIFHCFVFHFFLKFSVSLAGGGWQMPEFCKSRDVGWIIGMGWFVFLNIKGARSLVWRRIATHNKEHLMMSSASSSLGSTSDCEGIVSSLNNNGFTSWCFFLLLLSSFGDLTFALKELFTNNSLVQINILDS